MSEPWLPGELPPLPEISAKRLPHSEVERRPKPSPRSAIERPAADPEMMWASANVWAWWATCRTAPLVSAADYFITDVGSRLLCCPWETWCAHCDNCWRCRAWLFRPAGPGKGLFRELVATLRDRLIGRSPGERVRKLSRT
jgi:hypothetical protein